MTSLITIYCLSKRCILTTIFGLFVAGNVTAQTINTVESQATAYKQEWVVVLTDPRPARLRGWNSNQYSGGAGYSGSIELKRIGDRFAKKNGLTLKQEWFIESLSVYCLIVEFNKDTNQTLKELENNKLVEWVQKSNDFSLLNQSSITTEKKNNSPRIEPQVSVPNYDGKGVVIAMIDSGIDAKHQDLVHAIKNVSDFVVTKKKKRSVSQAEVHGTAIAGVLIAQPNHNIGTAGIAPAAKLLAFRGCWEEKNQITNCNTLSLARALDAVIKSNPDILNLSLSGPHDALLNKLIDKIVKNDTLIVAAFDPKRTNSQRFPSPGNGILIVRAESMDRQNNKIFTAPGSRLVTSPDDNYSYLNGHSIASAHTSGLLALLSQASSQNPHFQSTIDMAVNGKLKSAGFLLDVLQR